MACYRGMGSREMAQKVKELAVKLAYPIWIPKINRPEKIKDTWKLSSDPYMLTFSLLHRQTDTQMSRQRQTQRKMHK